MLNLKNMLISILIVLAASLSTWSIYISKKYNLPITTDDSQPDAYMEKITATIINKDGERAMLIESPRMVHYTKDDVTVIHSPHIAFFRESPEPWHINSDFAKASNGIHKIYFWDNVVIHHPHDESVPITTFKTATLTIFPKEKIAKTEDAVTVSQPDTTVHAIGMTANLNDGEIKLLSDARGEYDPPT